MYLGASRFNILSFIACIMHMINLVDVLLIARTTRKVAKAQESNPFTYDKSLMLFSEIHYVVSYI